MIVRAIGLVGWMRYARGAVLRRAAPLVPGVPKEVGFGRRSGVVVGVYLGVMAAVAPAAWGQSAYQPLPGRGAGLGMQQALTAAPSGSGGGVGQAGNPVAAGVGAPIVGAGAPPVAAQLPGAAAGQGGNNQGGVNPPIDPDAETKKAMAALFKDVMWDKNPLSPEEERASLKQSEDAARARTRQAPKFSSVMQTVPLDPSSEVPVVEMDLGQPTAISFIDMTGQAWPIQHCDWSAGFEGDKPIQGGHVLVLKTTELVENGSLVCLLEALTTPVRLRLSAGSHKHYLGFDARIPKNGPHAKPAPYDLGGASLVAGNDVISAFLYGIPPSGAEEVDVAGGGNQTRAWRYGGAMYVRTPMVLLSPGPKEEARREGVNVYKIAPLPDLTFDDDGHDVDVRIKGARIVRAAIPKDIQNNEEAPGPVVFVGDREAGISGGQP